MESEVAHAHARARRRVRTCARLLLHLPGAGVQRAAQEIKQRHEQAEVGLPLGVVDHVVPARTRAERHALGVKRLAAIIRSYTIEHAAMRVQLSFST